jgi:hypothetical protein
LIVFSAVRRATRIINPRVVPFRLRSSIYLGYMRLAPSYLMENRIDASLLGVQRSDSSLAKCSRG